MSTAAAPRCHVCGSRVGPLEPATLPPRAGPGVVCADGYACAQRANGQRKGLTLAHVTTGPLPGGVE